MSSKVVATFRSRGGVDWYLHEGRTKTGKPKYFVAKKVGPGALGRMPEGFEFTESINGVVSVRRVDPNPGPVAASDAELVERELQSRKGGRYRVEAKKKELIVYEPEGVSGDELDDRAAMLGLTRAALEAAIGPRRFTPVMRFVADGEGNFRVERMTDRGAGGWSWPLDAGPLESLAKKYLKTLGTEEFFELI